MSGKWQSNGAKWQVNGSEMAGNRQSDGASAPLRRPARNAAPPSCVKTIIAVTIGSDFPLRRRRDSKCNRLGAH